MFSSKNILKRRFVVKTLHSLHGVSAFIADNHEDMRQLVLNKIEIYRLDTDVLLVNEIADIIAKVAVVKNNPKAVICTTDRVLGDVGIACVGGIKAIHDKDVWSTREQRQVVSDKEELVLDTHVVSDTYPEYWVNDTFIQYVWVRNSRAELIAPLSQLLGLILGLNVVIYN